MHPLMRVSCLATAPAIAAFAPQRHRVRELNE
jgi:hypothetical protein